MEEDKTSSPLSNALVLDVSTANVQVGIAKENGWKKIVENSNSPMDGVFQSVAQLFEELEMGIKQIDSIFFCAGPGSTLGLRLTLAFVKTVQWECENKLALYSYNALDLASQMVTPSPVFVQAPFRMGWRIVRSSSNQHPIGKKEIFKSEEALKKFPSSVHLQDPRRKINSIEPDNILEYRLNKMNGLSDLIKISEPKEELEIYSPRPPEFKKWVPEIKFLSPDS